MYARHEHLMQLGRARGTAGWVKAGRGPCKDWVRKPRSRAHIDVSRNTLSRALHNVPMRTGYGDCKRQESNLWVRESTAREIMRGCKQATAERPEEGEDFEPENEEEEGTEENAETQVWDGGAGEESQGEQGEAGTREPAEMVYPLVPWAKSEALSREIQNIYQPTHQVIFAGGEGEDALAAVREKVPTLVMVNCTEHAEVMRQHLISTIMLEHANSVDDGFVFGKFLSRERSVGGESVTPEPGKPAAKKRRVDDGSGKSKTRERTASESSRSSSSSSAGD